MGRSCCRATVLLLVVAIASCDRAVPLDPSWIDLRSEALVDESRREIADLRLTDGRSGTLWVDGPEAWLEMSFDGSDWRPSSYPSVWFVEHVAAPSTPDASTGPVQLELASGSVLEARALTEFDASGSTVAPGTFVSTERQSLLAVEEGASVPETARIRFGVARAALGAEGWSFDGDELAGLGLPLWPGESIRFSEVPTGELAAELVVEPFPWLDVQAGATLEVELSRGGRNLWSSGRLPADRAAVVPIRVELEGSADEPLVVEARGGLARVGLLAPRVRRGPARSASRSPNIVVVQADTLRADGLGVYGSPDGLTPFLDSLADEGWCFMQARSAATSTLPAHATFFSGLYPRRAGVLGHGRPLPDRLVTLTERLHAAGYRTGAVTDGVMASARFGFAQGFEWFHERPDATLDDTRRRVAEFLALDDGRPVFLFVQTYAAHAPYSPSSLARARFGARLGVEAADTTERWYDEFVSNERTAADDRGEGPKHRALSKLEDLYRLGIVDVDRGVEGLVGELRSGGWLEGGYLVFTSDHGETFLEHRSPFHFGPPYEEQLRVPLFVIGGGLEPRRVERPVSWIDLPPTLLDLAGLEAPTEWSGLSLLDPSEIDPDRTLLAFQARAPASGSAAALIRSDRKVFVAADPGSFDGAQALAAFDLRVDPSEQHDLAGEVEWASELLEAAAPALERATEPVEQRGPVSLGARDLERLQRLGYATEGE